MADDVLNGKNHAKASVWLKVANHTSEPGTKHEFRTDAWLTPDEARMLAATLTVYADRADRGNKLQWAGSTKDIPKYLH